MIDFELKNLDSLKNLNTKTVLFGTGFYGKLAYSALQQKGVEIECFVDENPTQHGKSLYDKTKISRTAKRKVKRN